MLRPFLPHSATGEIRGFHPRGIGIVPWTRSAPTSQKALLHTQTDETCLTCLGTLRNHNAVYARKETEEILHMTPSKPTALEVILDKAIDERLEAAQIGDAGALRQLRSNLNSILLGTSLPRALRVRVINQIATCDLDLGDLGIFDNLTESQDRITHILSKPFGGD